MTKKSERKKASKRRKKASSHIRNQQHTLILCRSQVSHGMNHVISNDLWRCIFSYLNEWKMIRKTVIQDFNQSVRYEPESHICSILGQHLKFGSGYNRPSLVVHHTGIYSGKIYEDSELAPEVKLGLEYTSEPYLCTEIEIKHDRETNKHTAYLTDSTFETEGLDVQYIELGTVDLDAKLYYIGIWYKEVDFVSLNSEKGRIALQEERLYRFFEDYIQPPGMDQPFSIREVFHIWTLEYGDMTSQARLPDLEVDIDDI